MPFFLSSENNAGGFTDKAEHVKPLLCTYWDFFLIGKQNAIIFITEHDYLSCIHFYTVKYC